MELPTISQVPQTENIQRLQLVQMFSDGLAYTCCSNISEALKKSQSSDASHSLASCFYDPPRDLHPHIMSHSYHGDQTSNKAGENYQHKGKVKQYSSVRFKSNRTNTGARMLYGITQSYLPPG